MAARKHQEVIKAWADGAEIQYKQPHSGKWVDAPEPAWMTDYEYRVKPPESERVYPKISLDPEQEFRMMKHFSVSGPILGIMNDAIRRACDEGLVVTREEFDRAIGERDKRDLGIALAIYDASFDWCTKQLSSRSKLPALEIQAIIAGVK